MDKDVAYFLNYHAQQRRLPFVAINGAVEESRLAQRKNGIFLPQDQVVYDQLRPDDVLVCCVGGHDIALAPTRSTILAMASLAYLTPMWCLRGRYGWGLGFGHFRRMYHHQLQAFLETITRRCRPRVIVPCLVYNPCVHGSGWADRALSALNYNKNPQKLHRLSQLIFERAVKRIRIQGSIVAPVNFGSVLDPFDEADYVARVEPSEIGGEKMALAILDAIVAADQGQRVAE